MADESRYSTCNDSASEKIKSADQTPPSPRHKPTCFSAPITSLSPDSAPHAPPPSCSNVAASVDDFQVANQLAQEIASPLLTSNAASAELDAKRPEVDNGTGFDSCDQILGSSPSAPSPVPVSCGMHKTIGIPNGAADLIVGKNGKTLDHLQRHSGANINIIEDTDADTHSLTTRAELVGTSEQISMAEQLINEVLAKDKAEGFWTYVMQIPYNKADLVIGKDGRGIQMLEARSGANIQMKKVLQIRGIPEQIEAAKQLIYKVIGENVYRTPEMAVGNSYQVHQAWQPSRCSPPGPTQIQYPGYGFWLPQPYYGPSYQYSMSKPSYPGYPQPAPTTGYACDNQQAPPEHCGYCWYYPALPQYGYGQLPPYYQQAYDYASSYAMRTNPTQEVPYGAPSTSQVGYGQDRPPYNTFHGNGNAARDDTLPDSQNFQQSQAAKESPGS